MTATNPVVSIVIPTHNRRASLERVLRALAVQSCPVESLDVIVVADGCTDSTPELSQERWPFALRITGQTGRGAAAARNRGAAEAHGELLIFLDDDIEPLPGFLSAHVAAHAAGDPFRVAIGYLPPDLQGRRDFFSIMLRAWWEAMFDRMREPGHRFAYSDLLSGNFSVRRSLFAGAGGFNEALPCHEDYELGLRLITLGARLQFVRDAAGWHHEHTNLARALGRKRDEGRADVALARLHPELAPGLPLSRVDAHLTRRSRALRKLALTRSPAGNLLEASCRSMLPLLEAARLRGRWRRLLDDLLACWYWRGVAESLEGAALDSVCGRRKSDQQEAHDLDLQAGLEAAMRELDAAAPVHLRLRWGPLIVGTVPAQPGAEPLQGRHLPALLRTRFAQRFADTLALADLLQATSASKPATPTARGVAEQRSA